MEMPELGMKHLGVGVVVILVVGLILFPNVVAIIDSGNATIGEANCSVNMEVTGYKDGVQVTAPILNNPFTVGGVAIDSFGVTVVWSTTGSGIDWSTFVLEGDINIELEIVGDDTSSGSGWVEKYSSSWSSTESSGNYSEMLVLGTDICRAEDMQVLGGYGDYEDLGWNLRISAPVSVSAIDGAGIALSDSVSPPMIGTLTVIWDSSLEVEGSWSWDY
jgi:hypothetical protein